MRSDRSYQREIARLKALLRDVQWTQPTQIGSPFYCAGCGATQDAGCHPACLVAGVTGDRGFGSRHDR